MYCQWICLLKNTLVKFFNPDSILWRAHFLLGNINFVSNLIANMTIMLQSLVLGVPFGNITAPSCSFLHILDIAGDTNTVQISTQSIQPFISLHKSHNSSPQQAEGVTSYFTEVTAPKSSMFTNFIRPAYRSSRNTLLLFLRFCPEGMPKTHLNRPLWTISARISEIVIPDSCTAVFKYISDAFSTFPVPNEYSSPSALLAAA